MFKAIHCIAPTYLSDRIVMDFDVNGNDTRGSDTDFMLYLPTLRKEAYRNSFMYMGGKLWNDLPEFIQNSTNIESFEHNYKFYKRITGPWQNRHLRPLAISQFLYKVMIFSLLHENSTPYMDMDFCISLGHGVGSHFMLYVSLLNMICICRLKVIDMFYFHLLPNASTIWFY